ncbi:MAG TPA: hypothetical protein DEQ68_09675 [Ruminococcaceae bacterium]|nr:hypothetical protein [Oscillospiraceae bacterium]
MRIEDVTRAAEQGLTVIHTHMNISVPCRISGVLSRFDKGRWTYSLELREIKSGCVIIAALEEVEVTK